MKRSYWFLLLAIPFLLGSKPFPDSLYHAFVHQQTPGEKAGTAIAIGQELYKNGFADSCMFWFEYPLSQETEAVGHSLKAKSAFWLGYVNRQRGAISASILAYEKSLGYYSVLQNTTLIASIRWNLGEAYLRIKMGEKAIRYFDLAESHFLASEYPADANDFFRDKGFGYWESQDFGNAILQFERALGFGFEDTLFMSQVENLLADSYRFQKETDKAKHHFQIAIDYARSKEGVLELAWPLNNLGYLYALEGQTDSALHYYMKAERTVAEYDFPEVKSVLMLNLANLHDKLGNSAKALAYTVRVIEEGKNLADQSSYLAALQLGLRLSSGVDKDFHDNLLGQLADAVVSKRELDHVTSLLKEQSTVAEGLLSQENQRLSSQLQEATQGSEFGQSFIAGLALLFGLIGFMLWHQRHKQLKLSQAETARLQAALLQKEAYIAEQQDKVAQQTASLHDVYRQMVAPNRDQAND